MSAFFATIDIETDDAWLLFSLIDNDKSGCIDLEEFVSGCLTLKGSAKAIQMAQLSYENKTVLTMVESLENLILDLRDDMMQRQKR